VDVWAVHNKEPHDLCISSNIMKVTIIKRTELVVCWRWLGGGGGVRGLVGKVKAWRPRLKRKNDI
jgi:hypothetical protein